VKQIWSVQALRALAATMVAIAHLQSDLARIAAPTLPDGFVIGAAGVDLFFVISGFVIVYSSERMFGHSWAPGYFFLRRVVRIVPMYWIFTTVMLAFLLWRFDGELAASGNSWQSVVASYLFWPYRRADGSTAPLHAVGWTLNYEMFFYALFAALVWLRRTPAVLGTIAILCALIVLGRFHLVPDPYSVLADPIVVEFTFGALIALAYRSGLRIPNMVAAAGCTVALAALVWSGVFGLGSVPRWLAWGVPSALLVGSPVLVRTEWMPHAVPLRWIVLLGDASYVLYLTHGFSLAASRHAVMVFAGPSLANASIPLIACISLVMMAFSIAVAIGVHCWFERPLTAALQRVIERRMRVRDRALKSALSLTGAEMKRMT